MPTLQTGPNWSLWNETPARLPTNTTDSPKLSFRLFTNSTEVTWNSTVQFILQLMFFDLTLCSMPFPLRLSALKSSSEESYSNAATIPRSVIFASSNHKHNRSTRPSTMAEPRATKPSDAFFRLPANERVRRENRPYEMKSAGMGIGLSRDPASSMEVLINNQGDVGHVNCPRTRYATVLTAKVMAHMSRRQAERDDDKGTRIGERESFDEIIVAEADRLCDNLDVPTEEMNQRRRNVTWKVLCGFNAIGAFNTKLDKILLIFAKIRLGHVHCNGNKLVAAL